MAEKKKVPKTTIVRTYPRRVRVSAKNPGGITIVDRHPRHYLGNAISAEELKRIAREYPRKGVRYPKADALDFEDGNRYDELIAVWVDYFNRKFPPLPPETPLDPDVIKALIGSESEFEADPRRNKKAFGIAQITPNALKTLQNPEGETKEYLFKGIRQKDLKDPEIGIPMGVRWIFRKKALARAKLGRPPTPEEIVLEYKGLLKSRSSYKENALLNFRSKYERLKKS